MPKPRLEEPPQIAEIDYVKRLLWLQTTQTPSRHFDTGLSTWIRLG